MIVSGCKGPQLTRTLVSPDSETITVAGLITSGVCVGGGGTKKTTFQSTSYLEFESVHSPMKTFTVNRKGYAHYWDMLIGCILTWLCLEGDGKGIKRLFIGLRGQRGSIGGARLQAR